MEGYAAGHPPVVLTIAGLDPSSGAGVTADLKVFAAHRLYGVAAVTALTVQATTGVLRSEPVSARLLGETLDCLAEDLPLAGVKIGMLATAANVLAVARFLEGLRSRADQQRPLVVLDPVLGSSSGHALLDPEGIEALKTRLLPLVDCITPNLDELLLLAGQPPGAGPPLPVDQSVTDAAGALAFRWPALAILATGGHLAQPHDYLLAPGLPPLWIEGEWVNTPATHGTGCAHSSAVLCGLVAGPGRSPHLDPRQAIEYAARAAKQYVTAALRAATPMGKGGGAMHHLHSVFPSYE